jgi:hypothetical protein
VAPEPVCIVAYVNDMYIFAAAPRHTFRYTDGNQCGGQLFGHLPKQPELLASRIPVDRCVSFSTLYYTFDCRDNRLSAKHSGCMTPDEPLRSSPGDVILTIVATCILYLHIDTLHGVLILHDNRLSSDGQGFTHSNSKWSPFPMVTYHLSWVSPACSTPLWS